MLQRDYVETMKGENTMNHPANDAPLHAWHAWLCHNADADGEHGEACPDGCAGENVDPERLAQYRALD